MRNEPTGSVPIDRLLFRSFLPRPHQCPHPHFISAFWIPNRDDVICISQETISAPSRPESIRVWRSARVLQKSWSICGYGSTDGLDTHAILCFWVSPFHNQSIIRQSCSAPFLWNYSPAIPIVAAVISLSVISNFAATSFMDPGILPRVENVEVIEMDRQMASEHNPNSEYQGLLCISGSWWMHRAKLQ